MEKDATEKEAAEKDVTEKQCNGKKATKIEVGDIVRVEPKALNENYNFDATAIKVPLSGKKVKVLYD